MRMQPELKGERLTTPLTKLFGIQHPILLAGMNVAAGPELAAAVSNAGGLGVRGAPHVARIAPRAAWRAARRATWHAECNKPRRRLLRGSRVGWIASWALMGTHMNAARQVIGGVGYTPKMLKSQIETLKCAGLPFQAKSHRHAHAHTQIPDTPTQTCTNTHTHTHTHALTHTHTHTHTLTHSLSLTHSHARMHAHTHTHTHT